MLVREEDPEEFQATLTKIDQVVIRKTQNMLTCLFRQNKTEFREILRLKSDQSEDYIRIEHLFAHYENVKQMQEVSDSEVDTLSKRVLKVS
jgi:ERCC4-type nuclease